MNEQRTTSPCFHHQLGHFANPANILDTIHLGESQVPVEPVANVITVQHQRVHTARMQFRFHKVGDSRLAGAGQAREPQHRRFVVHQSTTLGLADSDGLMVNVCCTPQGEIDHSGCDGLVGRPIDQDERASCTVVRVCVERYRPRN